MEKIPHPQFTDPNNAPDATPSTSYKACSACQANLPLSAFGLFKFSKSGFRDICKECRSQEFRLYRKIAYNTKSKIDDSLIRSVINHNTNILNSALTESTYALQILGFDVVLKVDYKVFFGPSKVEGMKCVSIFDTNDQLFREFTYAKNEKDVTKTILSLLRNLNIRLEKTEFDVINSKTLIYYI